MSLNLWGNRSIRSTLLFQSPYWSCTIYYMKGKCCGFKFLDKIFRDKGKSFTFIPFSLLACAVVYKKQAGMQVQLSGDSAIWYTESKCCTNPFRVSFWWLMSATNRPWHCLCNQSVPLLYNNNTNTCIV